MPNCRRRRRPCQSLVWWPKQREFPRSQPHVNDRRLKATALRVGRQKLTAACGQFTVGPASENVGSVRIRVVRVTAGLAAESRLIRTVGFGNMLTAATFTGRITRVHPDQFDPCERRFIFQEQPQLRESPTMQNGTLPAPNFYPLSNTTEVLNGNTAPGAFSVGNDLLRYYVVHVAGETLFLARQFPQSAVCRCRLEERRVGKESRSRGV